MRPRALDGIEAVALDAFGTLCTGRGPGELLNWHGTLPAREAQQIRRAWMRGQLGPTDLVRMGDASWAPPAEVLIRIRRAQAVADEIAPYPDSIPALRRLRARGLQLAIVSNVIPPAAVGLRRLFADYLDCFVLSCEVGATKPDPRIYRALIEALGIPPQRILMIGDGKRADVRGAEACGLRAHLIDRSSQARDAVRRQLFWTGQSNCRRTGCDQQPRSTALIPPDGMDVHCHWTSSQQ